MRTERTSKLPPFYTHVIGSLPRPQAVRDLLARRAQMPPERFTAALDDMVRFAIRLQEQAGIAYWMFDVGCWMLDVRPLQFRTSKRSDALTGTALPTLLVGCLGLALSVISAFAQWSPIATGLEYREFSLPGPVRVFAVRADRTTNTWTIDAMKGQGTMKGGHETVPNMAERYNDSITFDGHRYALRAAINGDYYHATGVPLQGQIMAGWFVKRFEEYGGISGFAWTSDRRALQGGNVRNGPQLQHVVFEDQARMQIDQLNEPRAADALALYTWHFAPDTGTKADGAEVVVRMKEPLSLFSNAKGEIVKVRQNAGASPLPFNHIVLSAHGKAAAELLRHARVGQPASFQLELKDYGSESIGLAPQDWRGAYASIGAPKNILINGTVPRDWEAKAKRYAEQGKKHGSVVKDPRTAIAYSDRYLYFLVIDGRSKESVGMTFTETGFFCRDELKATNAVLQDGGGSSTLWLDGKVKNTASGKGKDEKYGVLRAVSNGYFIAEVLPPKKSTELQTGQKVRLKGELRLGPGSTFGSAGTVSDTDPGTVLPDALSGIYAKGNYWWLCRFGDADGWASLDRLTPVR